MDLICKNCYFSIPGENVSIQSNIAKCVNCNSIFSLNEFSETSNDYGYEKEHVSLPKNMNLKREYNGLIITRKWFSPKTIFFIIFSLFWNGFMAIWFFIAITQKQYEMAAFGSLHALVGIFILYYTIASLVNNTFINVNATELKISHSPVPWFTPKPFKVNDFKQLYSKHRVSYSNKGGRSDYYTLRAKSKTGKDLKVLSGLSNKEQVRYLEQEIEKYLGIIDEHIDGEMS